MARQPRAFTRQTPGWFQEFDSIGGHTLEQISGLKLNNVGEVAFTGDFPGGRSVFTPNSLIVPTNHVTPNFAYEMRNEDRLGGFRKYLREVWKAAEGSPDPAQANTLARDFSDGLEQAYQESEE